MRILRRADRARLTVVKVHDACGVALSHPRWELRASMPGLRPIVPAAWSLAAYGSSFLDAFDMDAVRAARRRAGDPVPDRPPDLAARFDIRIHDGMVIYARDGCTPEDLRTRFFLHVEPVDPADLPEERRRYGFDNLDFTPRLAALAYPWPPGRSARATWTRRGDRCLVAAPLPDYPVRRVRTGQIVRGESGGWRSLWEGEIDLGGAERR